MTYQALLAQIRNKRFAPVYFFCGEEEYLMEQALDALLQGTVSPDLRAFNLNVLYAREVEGGKILEIANAYPMMAERRVVVVKQVMDLPGSALEALAKYAAKPAPTTVLILTAEKADFRRKGAAELKAHSCFVEFKPLYENQIGPWLKEYVRDQGYEITPAAALLIQTRLGNNLREIVNEIEKIKLILNGGTRIGEDEVARSVGLHRDYRIFDLTDAVGHRDLKRALQILHRMLESGESPTGIVAMLTRQCVTLVRLKEAGKKRLSQKQASALTGIPVYFVKKTQRMADNFAEEDLERWFECLHETDLALKTSQQPPEIALQTLLIQAVRA